MSTNLLKTKFHIPNAHGNLVQRPHLIDRLNDGLRNSRSLTLVSAPAGYGKTTLMADWLGHLAEGYATDRIAPSAWLSLDKEDDEPIRFFSYLLASIQQTGLHLEETEHRLLGTKKLSRPSVLVTTLLNEISQPDDGRRLIVVLDDYHRIRTSVVHEAIQFWLDHAPTNLHLVLVTREDPPLTLSRLRVQNQITDIRAADLRLSKTETGDFFNKAMNLCLSADEIARLKDRTEGWVAGLQLAGLALQSPDGNEGRTDRADFINDFSGNHRYIIDYLIEEVLLQQSEAVSGFLLQTAVLDRLNPALCDAVTGRSDSRSILAHLERSNLFLVPLDHKRHWYRYHHLLAESLRANLDNDERLALHRRAALWCEANDLHSEAVHHALATGNMALAADLIERVIQQASAWSRGEVGQLTGWLNALPEALLRLRPTLCLHASRAFYLAGDLSQADQLLQQAEDSLRDRATGTVDAGTVDVDGPAVLATVYRSAISALRGQQLDQTIAAAQRLLGSVASLDRHTAARTADTLGLALGLKGELAAAESAYATTAKLAEKAGVHYLAINARCEEALMQIGQGRLTEATQTCRMVLETADGEDIPPLGLAWAILGEIERERNELASASEHLSAGIALSERGRITDDLRYAYIFLARLKQAQGDADAALIAWRQADLILRGFDVERLAWLSAAERAQLDLAQGNRSPASRWAKEYRRQRDGQSVEYLQELEDLTLARVLLATGELNAALHRVQSTLAAAQTGGRIRTVIEALILHALIRQADGQTEPATAALIDAVALASSDGFVRLFLDAGPAMPALLCAIKDSAPEFVDRLLTGFSPDQRTLDTESTRRSVSIAQPPVQLIEPLSQREMDVLRLLVAGRSNSDIADELVITVGTAKWHVHNIYQKLGVGSRGAAIARAHAWHLVTD